MRNQFDLSDRTIIITGGGGLLGREYAQSLSQAGATVVLSDIRGELAAEAIDQVRASGGKGLAIPTDITKPDSVAALVAQTVAEFGGIHGLLNNAALDPKFDAQHAGEHPYTFENYPLALWNASLAVNLTGMFLCSQAVAPVMLAQGAGVIINISSIYGLVGPDQRLYEHDDPRQPIDKKPVDYSVTKSAVVGFTRYLAAYYAGRGVRVNTLTLGGVYNQHADEFVRRYAQRAPLGRMADRAEYGGAVNFLFSDAASYMTGSNLIVDGGWTAW